MFVHAHPWEVAATAFAGLLLTALCILLALPVPVAGGALDALRLSLLLAPGVPVALTLILALIMMFGLVIGFLRHRDFSPLFFALLGVGMLTVHLMITGAGPSLPLLCGLSIITAAAWSVTAPTLGDVNATPLPTLDDFLDNNVPLPPHVTE